MTPTAAQDVPGLASSQVSARRRTSGTRRRGPRPERREWARLGGGRGGGPRGQRTGQIRPGAVDSVGPGADVGQAAQHRYADDRRHRLERFRLLFGRRRIARASDAERRSHGQGRCRLHQLVWPGKLHRRPRLVHHRAHSGPFGAVDRGRPGGREFPAQGNANDRRVLQEERLLDVLLRQVASRRQAGVLSDRARLRRDEEFRRLLCRRLHLRLHQQVVPPLVSVVQSGVRQVPSTKT